MPHRGNLLKNWYKFKFTIEILKRSPHLKTEPISTSSLGAGTVRLCESMLCEGAVALGSKVPKPLPPGISWERITSEKNTDSFFQCRDGTAGSSPCDEKGASVHVTTVCYNIIAMTMKREKWRITLLNVSWRVPAWSRSSSERSPLTTTSS